MDELMDRLLELQSIRNKLIEDLDSINEEIEQVRAEAEEYL